MTLATILFSSQRDDAVAKMLSEFEASKSAQQKEFKNYKARLEEEYKNYKKELARYWEEPQLSKKKSG